MFDLDGEMIDFAARRAIVAMAKALNADSIDGSRIDYLSVVEPELSVAPVEPDVELVHGSPAELRAAAHAVELQEGPKPGGVAGIERDFDFVRLSDTLKQHSTERLTPEEAQLILYHSDIEASRLLEVEFVVAKLRRIAERKT